MVVSLVSTAPNRELYDKVAKVVDLENNRPAGLVFHAAAELPSGEVQIVDVYESPDALRAAEESLLFPAFAEAGVTEIVAGLERPQVHEVFELVR